MSVSVICPLPPLQERCFPPEQAELVQHVFNVMDGELTSSVLLLYKHAEGLKIGTYVIGSGGPRYYHSSIVLALKRGILSLAKVEFYAQCSAVYNESNTTRTEWLAAVSWFTEHPCRIWYGSPTQVWCSTTDSFEFIPVCHIKCRVVYINASVYFGRMAGTDSVIVVSPLEFCIFIG